jgi:phosphoglycolate phosphatase
MIRLCGGGSAAFVGDTLADTGAARAAGIPCVAVSFSDRAAQELGAHAVIDHLAILPRVLRSLG